jgi:hypothetical protein
MRRGIALATVVVALGAALATITSAIAAGVVAGSRVSIKEDSGVYYGRVFSHAPICKRHRMVVLFKVRPGRDRKLDHDRTDRRHGRWTIVPVPDLGKRAATHRFYVRVWPRPTSRNGTGFVCHRTRSRVITVAG